MQGYDVIDFPGAGSVLSPTLPLPKSVLEEHYEFYKRLAEFAVAENNKQKVSLSFHETHCSCFIMSVIIANIVILYRKLTTNLRKW